MKILLFRLAAKATIACIAAAIAFSAAPRAAEAEVTGFVYGSTFTSDPGETLTYAPSIGNVELETSVYSGAGLGLGEGEPDQGTLNGDHGSLSVGFSATAFFDADEGVPATLLPPTQDENDKIFCLTGWGTSNSTVTPARLSPAATSVAGKFSRRLWRRAQPLSSMSSMKSERRWGISSSRARR